MDEQTPEQRATIRQALTWALAWLDGVEQVWGNGPLLDAMPNNCPSRAMMRAALALEGSDRAMAAGDDVTIA